MNAAVNRRVFVASVAAGLPALAGAAYGRPALVGRGHDHVTAGADADAVLDHVVRELAVIHNRGKARGFSGEDARAIAAQLRTAAVRSGQVGIDAAATSGVQRLIRSRGRDAVLAIDIDRARMKAQLERYSIEVDDRWFAAGLPDHAMRRKALDILIGGGVTDVLTHATRVFDKLGSVLDAHAGAVTRVRRVQSDPSWWAICSQLAGEIAMLWGQAIPICEASEIVPGLDIVCAAIYETLATYYVLYWSYCV